jgi:hypothetical protein
MGHSHVFVVSHIVLAVLSICYPFNSIAQTEETNVTDEYRGVTVDELAYAIRSAFGNVAWWECGKAMDQPQDIESRSVVYAKTFIERAREKRVSPVMMTAIVEQESTYDECALGKRARDRAKLPMHPSYDQTYAELGTKEKRSRYGLHHIEVGAAQYMWPRASMDGQQEAVSLRQAMTMDWSIGNLGRSLASYLDRALSSRPQGFTFVNAKRRPVLVPANFGYFVYHNSSTGDNDRYFFTIKSRGSRIMKAIDRYRADAGKRSGA